MRHLLSPLVACLPLLSLGCNGSPPVTPPERGVLLVGNAQGDNVVRLDEETGEFLGDFVPRGSGGLMAPGALVLGLDGDLYVASGDTVEDSAVLRYDGRTGRFVDRFASGHGLLRPSGLVFGQDGLLYVSSFRSDQILRFNGRTGAFVDVFVTGDGQPGGLNGPGALALGPEGQVYVATSGSVAVDGEPTSRGLPGQVLRYDTRTREAEVFVEQLALSAAGADSLHSGLVFGPDCVTSSGACDLFVSDFAHDIRRYDLGTGALKATLSTNGSGNVPTTNHLGGLVIGTGRRLYTVGFDSTSGMGASGAVLRFDASTNAPLPAEGQTGAILVPPDARLVRPVGIAFALQRE
jgi:sugar lactone lactonase YvrE